MLPRYHINLFYFLKVDILSLCGRVTRWRHFIFNDHMPFRPLLRFRRLLSHVVEGFNDHYPTHHPEKEENDQQYEKKTQHDLLYQRLRYMDFSFQRFRK